MTNGTSQTRGGKKVGYQKSLSCNTCMESQGGHFEHCL